VDLAYYVAVWRLAKDYHSGQGSKGYRYVCIADDKISNDIFADCYTDYVFGSSKICRIRWTLHAVVNGGYTLEEAEISWQRMLLFRKRVAFWLKTLRKYRWSL
jgi:hypothetical protein